MAQSLLDEATYLKQVREHYEELPYPPRDPARELEGLVFATNCGLDRFNYYHGGGRRDFSRPFEILVAGCGTGDAVVSLAAQLYGSQARITALDMSTASLAVAKGRLEARGLDNVRFVHDSLLNVARHADKPFDLINCIGVLHHLEVPEAGLQALEKVLAPEGVMHLMLYALYGRESVYQMQALMRLVNAGEPNMQRKVDTCRRMLEALPAHHGFRQFVNTIEDVTKWGDSGLYDLLLHSNDVAYTVPQVYAFLETAGLVPTHWFFGIHGRGNHLYKPETAIHDPQLRAQVMALPLAQRQAVAELMDGTIARHEFYAARAKPALPPLDDLDMVPQLDVVQPLGLAAQLGEALQNLTIGHQLQVQFHGYVVTIVNTPHAGLLLGFMDGATTLRSIYKKVRDALPAGKALPNNAELQQEFEQIFAVFNQYDLMFVRHHKVPAYRTVDEAAMLRGKKA